MEHSRTLHYSTDYIPQLTGVRAIAAYMVYIHHFPPVYVLHPVLLQLTKEMHTGVGLFFVLSGFLIFQRYYVHAQPHSHWWSVYIRNRVARIYPMYFLLTCVTFASRLIRHHEFELDTFLLNITFLRGFSFQYLFTGIHQGWTLTVEECFYFSAPVLFFAIRRWNFLVPLGFIYCTGGILWALGSVVNVQQFFTPLLFMFYYTFFGRCFEFFCGMWLAKFIMDREQHHRIPQTRHYTWIGIIGAGLCLYLMALQQPESQYMGSGLFTPLGGALNNFVLPIFYTMIYYGLLVEQSWIRRFLASDVMVLLGKSSYIYYLIHMGVIQAAVDRISPDFRTWYGALIQFVLLNAIAIALFKFLEEPLNHWIRRHWTWGIKRNVAAHVS
ncbi:MAG: acyltransferase [Bacteroidota bacterium]|nr:acyltransferase [Candidatus Kapabacteria bacterium]MDW8219504.1 acyltransferase [Bacteroidota bacterium]